MYLALKYWLRTLFLRLLLETGLPFYVVFRATRRSSCLQGKDLEYWSGPGSWTHYLMLCIQALYQLS